MEQLDLAELRNDRISELSGLVVEFNFRLREIPSQLITVRIYETADSHNGDHYRFETSHLVHEPDLAGTYMPGNIFGTTVEEAARRAIASIADSVANAVRRGHSPSPDWLVPTHS
jgi:hypothetical protein